MTMWFGSQGFWGVLLPVASASRGFVTASERLRRMAILTVPAVAVAYPAPPSQIALVAPSGPFGELGYSVACRCMGT